MTAVELGTLLVLSPRTRKGANRLREAGTNTWRVLSTADTVLFEAHKGPWLLVEPVTDDDRKSVDRWRWIHGMQDTHFFIDRTR